MEEVTIKDMEIKDMETDMVMAIIIIIMDIIIIIMDTITTTTVTMGKFIYIIDKF